MWLLAIDPGKVGMGWALFDHVRQTLVGCHVVPEYKGRPGHRPTLGELCNHAGRHVPTDCSTVVVEQMQARSMKEAADLLTIQAIAAYAAGRSCASVGLIHYYTPQQWKGSVPKTVMERRIRSKLAPDELATLPTGAKAHNAIDAVGLGLYHLGRL